MKKEKEFALQQRLYDAGGTKDERFKPVKDPSHGRNMKYDFMTAPEIAEYLEIGLTQSYDICKKINEDLEQQGYLVFRGKVPRAALRAKLYKQEDVNAEEGN